MPVDVEQFSLDFDTSDMNMLLAFKTILLFASLITFFACSKNTNNLAEVKYKGEILLSIEPPVDTVRELIDLDRHINRDIAIFNDTIIARATTLLLNSNRIYFDNSRDTLGVETLIGIGGSKADMRNIWANERMTIGLSDSMLMQIVNCDFPSDLSLFGPAYCQRIDLSNVSARRLYISQINCDTLQIGLSNIKSLVIDSSSKFKIIDCRYLDSVTENMLVTNWSRPNANDRITLYINPLTASKLNIDFSVFKLKMPKNIRSDLISAAYLTSLERVKKLGQFENYEILDKDFRNWKYYEHGAFFDNLFGIVQLYWWDYGYSRHYIFYWLFGSLLGFSIINYWLVYRLNREVYELPGVSRLMRNTFRNSILNRWHISFTYTALIFLSLHVQMDKLKLEKKGLLYYFFFIYIFGLLCLAYLANYILKS